MLDDNTFIHQFENQTLEPSHFNHQGHMRLAWLYLNRLSFNQALNRVCQGIKAYAESLGAKDKFHWTITDALVRIIAGRIVPNQSWREFVDNNPDLLENALDVLQQYYSKEVLHSDEARMSVLSPDIKAIGV